MAPKKDIEELYEFYQHLKAMQTEEYRALRNRQQEEIQSLRREHEEALEPHIEALKKAAFATCPWGRGEDFHMYGTDSEPQRWRVTGIEVRFHRTAIPEPSIYWTVHAKRVRKDGATYGDPKTFDARAMLLYARTCEAPDDA